MTKSTTLSLSKVVSYLLGIILFLVPFQAFITTWLGSNFGHLDVFRIWKELLMVSVTIGALLLLKQSKPAREWLVRSRLLLLIILYVGLHIFLGLLAVWQGRVNGEALIYSLLINTRLFIILVAVYSVASRYDWLTRNWSKLLLWPACVVVLFGLLQVLVLPDNFLSHFGYGSTTIPAIHTIDQKLEYQRIQSTLRGPNPLGAYLVIITGALSWLIFSSRKEAIRLGRLSVVLAASLLALFWTYSRSAWIGMGIAYGFLVWKVAGLRNLKKSIITVLAVGAIMTVGIVFVLRDNNHFQNIIFHTDENSAAVDSSNADRASALSAGLHDVVYEPWGRGPGTAGPASFRNDRGQARIAENYYLQIGQEVGLVGLMLFVAVNGLIVVALWRKGGDLATILLSTWLGITAINMLSHAWADDTLAYVWWGLAGLALARPVSTSSVILNKRRKNHAKKG